MVGAIVTIATIVFQTIFFRKLQDDEPMNEDSFISMSIS